MPRFHPLFFPPRRAFLRAALAWPSAVSLSGLGGLVTLGGCGGSSHPVAPQASAPAGPIVVSVTDRRVKVAHDVSLHVRDWQCDNCRGPAIVLLPGLGANAYVFDGLAHALAPRSRVIAVSRRGYGQSDKPLPVRTATEHYEVDTLVADLHALLDGLGLDRVVLAGHSIAGNELTRFAGRHPQRVRGLVYLDATFDHTRNPGTGGLPVPDNRLFREPVPNEEDGASMEAAIAYARRTVRHWSAPLEANLRDQLDPRPDGSVRLNTPAAVADAMDTASHSFSPDYTPVRAPALVVTAMPGDIRDIFPALPETLDDATQKDAAAYLRAIRYVRIDDAARLVAALKTRHRLVLEDACHGDFFIERESELVRAIEAMRWA